MGDDDELALTAKLANHVGVPLAVCLVERGIGLIEDEERRGIHLRHREDECNRGERPLATGEHFEPMHFLTWQVYRDGESSVELLLFFRYEIFHVLVEIVRL